VTGVQTCALPIYASSQAIETVPDNSRQDFETRKKSIEKKFNQLAPKGPYVVIDTGGNTLYLRKGSETIHQAVISCGSGNVLEDPKGNRKWIFDTPRGAFTVKSKATDPSWIKPDWAFIEEGENIPHDWDDRVENGVLGDYALGFGQGYFIHGTLYTRLLGRNVTHGCIRVGDEDLEFLFKNVSIGTPIFIF
jgi:L,D-transpeptidase YbiS